MTVTSQDGNSNSGAQGGSGGDGGEGGNGGGEGGNQGDQGNQGAGSQSQGSQDSIDLSKLTPEQLNKVLENKDLYNTPRIKELRDKAAKADKLEKAQQEAETKKLEEDKKFEELAGKRADENKTLKEQLAVRDQNQALTNILVKDGVVDLAAALKLIDRGSLKTDDNGTVTGVDEAVKSLKDNSPYLFNKGSNGQVGSASNPANGGQAGGDTPKFKRSQLRDPAFYKANEKDILAAAQKGLIEDDINPGGIPQSQ